MSCAHKVTAIILNYNGYSDTIDCLSSILTINYPLLDVICIDNASTDKSVEKIIAWSTDKFDTAVCSNTEGYAEAINYSCTSKKNRISLKVIKNPENIGFAAGCNQGIKLARVSGEDYIWLLNNDTIVEPDSLLIMVQYLDENPTYHVTTPQIRLYDQPDLIWNCGGHLKWYGARKYLYIYESINAVPNREAVDITFVTGCAPLIRSALIHELGGFSEKFFFGEEDFEFSIRMKKANYKMACCFKSIIYHKVGSSISKISENQNIRKMYIYYLNRFVNLRKHCPPLFWHIWRIAYLCYIYILLKKQTSAKFSVRYHFLKKLMKDSLIMNEVDKKTFLSILNTNNDYFSKS